MSILSPSCPRCHNAPLFASTLGVVDQCASCGLALKAHDAGDGPAFFVVLVMGFLTMGLAGYIEYAYEPPMWLHALLWLPFICIGCYIGLRWSKAWLIALELKTHRLKDDPHEKL